MRVCRCVALLGESGTGEASHYPSRNRKYNCAGAGGSLSLDMSREVQEFSSVQARGKRRARPWWCCVLGVQPTHHPLAMQVAQFWSLGSTDTAVQVLFSSDAAPGLLAHAVAQACADAARTVYGCGSVGRQTAPVR